VPVILGADGRRAFRVAYKGRDFLPALTAEQERAMGVATAAREALDAIFAGTGQDIDIPVACTWAAALVPMAMHVAEGALIELGLIDDLIAVGTLQSATSVRLRLARQEA